MLYIPGHHGNTLLAADTVDDSDDDGDDIWWEKWVIFALKSNMHLMYWSDSCYMQINYVFVF